MRSLALVAVLVAACAAPTHNVRTRAPASTVAPTGAGFNRCMNADSIINGDSRGFCPWPTTTVKP